MTKERKTLLEYLLKEYKEQKKSSLKEDFNSIDLTIVKQKAKQLHLDIKLKPAKLVHQSYELYLYDTKSKFNTETFQFWKGSLDGKDFLDRVYELKKFCGNKVIFYNGDRVFIENPMIKV